MSRFLYLGDPLFWIACSLYAVNRWLLKPHFPSGFLHSHFNDVLLIPCALPPLLLLHRLLQLRADDRAPGAGEIAFHLAVWSMLFEWIGPRFVHHATGDLRDVAAYCAGGAVAWLWWNRYRLTARWRTHEL